MLFRSVEEEAGLELPDSSARAASGAGAILSNTSIQADFLAFTTPGGTGLAFGFAVVVTGRLEASDGGADAGSAGGRRRERATALDPARAAFLDLVAGFSSCNFPGGKRYVNVLPDPPEISTMLLLARAFTTDCVCLSLTPVARDRSVIRIVIVGSLCRCR